MTLLVLTGTMGSGKTSVLAEASDILRSLGVAHAAIDLDAFGVACLPDREPSDDPMYANLASVAENCVRLGLTRFLVARAVENDAELERCCRAVGATSVVVCRLVASRETMKNRVAEREQGILRNEFIQRVSILDRILDEAALEDFSISTENRTVTDAAREVLVRAGWILK